MAVDESRADQGYEWGVRILYAALIAGNLLLLWDQMKDSPSGLVMRARLAGWRAQLSDCEGCARRREWIHRQMGRVLWDATQTVEVGPDWDSKDREAPR